MKQIVFERELKPLINYVRAYGIQHMNTNTHSTNWSDEMVRKEFFRNVHRGFFLAQRNCVLLLKKILYEKKHVKSELKSARKNRDKEKIEELDTALNTIIYQEMITRKIMDSIAWQILDTDLSILRRLYYGQEPIDITDSNLESELVFVEKYSSLDNGSFALISDMTSFVQIGDIILLQPGEGLSICELKEGATNEKIFSLIEESFENQCPHFLYQKLGEENQKFREHFKRSLKQIERNLNITNVINGEEGTDLYTGLNVKIHKDEIVMDNYSHIVENLLNECNKKGHAIFVLENCLLIGAYRIDKFPHKVFDAWAKNLGIQMPIVDFRQSFTDPLAFPLFLQPFSDELIMDIISGKKIIKFTLDIERWLKTFPSNDISYRWMTEKETARINSKLKGKSKIFTLNGRGVEFKDNFDNILHLGEGAFSRMFTSLNTPSSIKKYLLTTLTYMTSDENCKSTNTKNLL